MLKSDEVHPALYTDPVKEWRKRPISQRNETKIRRQRTEEEKHETRLGITH